MPVFGERIAPTFDPAHPNELPRFFTRLEILFDRCSVQNNLQKKTYVTSYVDYELTEYWEALLPEFRNASKTYIDLRDHLLDFYHQRLFKYTVSDLNRIVDDCAYIGFSSLQHLSDFHMQFNKVASYLASIGLLSLLEQSQTYLRPFDPVLSSQISIQLQIKHRNRSQTRPYTIDEIYDAAHWILLVVLNRTSSSNSIPSNSPTLSQNELLEDFGRSKMLNCLYSAFNSEVSSFSASTSTLDLGTPSQDEADDRIAALEAELTALRAQINADEEEQSEYNDFDDSDASSHISPQHMVASSQNQHLSPHTSTHSLYDSNKPIFELTADVIGSEKNTVTSTPDLEILSQDIADNHIAALEAELAALQAQNSSDEEEQPQYDDFDDFISSTDLVLQKPAASIQNSYILPQSSIPSLSALIKPNLEPAY